MNLELFNESKWKILAEVTKKPQSALDLSSKFGTTISNLVQQLKILEYAGLISKVKEKSKGPGKAKTIYYLSSNRTFLINLDNNGAKQKEMKKTDHQNLTTNVWLYAKEEERYYLEKFFWANEDIIENSSLILLKKQNRNSIDIEVISEKSLARASKVNGNDRSREIKVKNIKSDGMDLSSSIILLDKGNISLNITGGRIE